MELFSKLPKDILLYIYKIYIHNISLENYSKILKIVKLNLIKEYNSYNIFDRDMNYGININSNSFNINPSYFVMKRNNFFYDTNSTSYLYFLDKSNLLEYNCIRQEQYYFYKNIYDKYIKS
jgi:hypothetical protein